ncbi:hypothetical protein B0I35DRAFT_482805 [Stachybotrys elegans]|uniref:Uncharacterized protein n=1 Tax=Stachybotrys elegans TaxID=80388 RepID=A0A8K0WLP4_9HYPO|nr:hypothetical protein B0I35DRAFT_482805 [Stachybotrys elegans]
MSVPGKDKGCTPRGPSGQRRVYRPARRRASSPTADSAGSRARARQSPPPAQQQRTSQDRPESQATTEADLVASIVADLTPILAAPDILERIHSLHLNIRSASNSLPCPPGPADAGGPVSLPAGPTAVDIDEYPISDAFPVGRPSGTYRCTFCMGRPGVNADHLAGPCPNLHKYNVPMRSRGPDTSAASAQEGSEYSDIHALACATSSCPNTDEHRRYCRFFARLGLNTRSRDVTRPML